MRGHSNGRCLDAFDEDELRGRRAGAGFPRGFVFCGLVELLRALEAREFDDYDAAACRRDFERRVASPTRDEAPAKFLDDARRELHVFGVLLGIGDLDLGNGHASPQRARQHRESDDPLGQRLLVQIEQTAPRSLRGRLVVDLQKSRDRVHATYRPDAAASGIDGLAVAIELLPDNFVEPRPQR